MRIVLRRLPLVTMCPHHLLPAEGHADVAFEPDRLWVGLGGIAALVELSGKRLILQEALSEEIADVIDEVLRPRWVRVSLRLAHACVRLRGERAHGSEVETCSTRGAAPSDGWGS